MRWLPIELLEALQGLDQVLVSAPTETKEVIALGRIRSASGGFGRLKKPGDCVGGLERGQDPLEPSQLPEGTQGLGIGDRLVACPTGVAKVSVLRTDTRIVEPGGD